MSIDIYKYKLTENAGNHTIWILLKDFPGPEPFNEWQEGSPSSDCLIIGGGKPKMDNVGAHCLSPGGAPQEVLVLKGASWSTTVGTTGAAELFLMQNSSAYYMWELIDISTQ